jgi:hypothetical protein
MLDELIPILFEVMIGYKNEIKIEKIIDICGYERGEVNRALNVICDIGLAFKIKDDKTNQVTYKLVKNLKGIHVAKAAQIGVDLGAFEHFFVIEKKEKELALELALQAEKIKNLDVSKRKPLLQKRTYFINGRTDDTYENLMLLFEAANSSLYEYIENLAKKDVYLSLLINMHQQAENSLRDYAENLK